MNNKIKLTIIIVAAICVGVTIFTIINLNNFKDIDKEFEGKNIIYSIESTITINQKSSDLELKSTVYAITDDKKLYIYDVLSNENSIIKKRIKKIKNVSDNQLNMLYEYLSNAPEEIIIPDGYLVYYDGINKYIEKSTGDNIIKECKLK